MFCPKCGIENPDNGKFCRGCGANLTNVLAVVDGEILIKNGSVIENDFTELYGAKIRKDIEKSMDFENNCTDLYSTGVRNAILGTGFAMVGFLLFTMPGDTIYWLMMMIPGFCLLASGVRRILKSKAMEKERGAKVTLIQPSTLSANQPINELPPSQTEYVSPMASCTTNDLVVPSVTEDTTKHLSIKK